ncbi:beta strand repeat-containing protein [Rudanella paleaurantiibacter]|nr:FG-GAP-like repeat-containing protein [Rudanella paleaurantiibacter]
MTNRYAPSAQMAFLGLLLHCLFTFSIQAATSPTDPPKATAHALLAPVAYSEPGSPFPALAGFQRRLFFDADNDGDIDILYQTTTTLGSGIGLNLNDGSGGFNTTHTATEGTGLFTSGPLNGIALREVSNPNSTTGLVALDYDNDGDTDLYETTSSSTGRILRNNNGSFSVQTSPFPALASFARRLFFDADNDGDVDILYQSTTVATNSIALRLNNGSGDFGTLFSASDGTGLFSSGPLNGITIREVNGPTSNTALVAVDYDNDGDTDLYETVAGGAGRVLRNNNGSFSVQTSPFPTIAAFRRQVFFDVDSDGDIDILYQTGTTAGNDIGLRLNNGSGDFSNIISATNGSGSFPSGPLSGISFQTIGSTNSAALYAIDYDNDGDTDLFEGTASSAGRIIRQNESPPVISSTNPANNATNVSITANLVLTFNRSMAKGTGNLYLVRTSNNSIVETIPVTSAQVTGSGTTWTVNPNSTLASLTNYALRADEGTFFDADGRIFRGILTNTIFNFTTGCTPPSVSINPNSAVLTCTQPTQTLTAIGTGTFRWSTTATTPTITVNTTGTFSVTLTDANGCTATASSNITSNTTAPGATLAASGPLNCTATSVTLTAGTTSGTSFAFSSGAVQVGGASGPTATVSSAGLYSVTVTGTNGCTSVASTNVAQNNTITGFTVSGSGSACSGSTVLLTANGCTGGTVAWPGGVVGSTFSASLTGSYTATCTIGTCTTTATGTATINTPAFAAAPTLSTNTPLPGQALSLSYAATQCPFNNAGPFSVELSTDNFASQTALTPTTSTSTELTVDLPGTLLAGTAYQLRVVYQTNTFSPPASLTVQAPVALSISASQTSVCIGNTIQLTATGCPDGEVHWSTGETGASIVVSLTATSTISASCVVAPPPTRDAFAPGKAQTSVQPQTLPKRSSQPAEAIDRRRFPNR